MTSEIRPYRFLFRARVIGKLDWVCPCCGHFNRTHLRPVSYVLYCKNPDCQRAWGLGHVLHQMPETRRAVPDDYTIPSNLIEAFPEGDVGKWWRSGQLMHCVHTATGTLAIPDFDDAVRK